MSDEPEYAFPRDEDGAEEDGPSGPSAADPLFLTPLPSNIVEELNQGEEAVKALVEHLLGMGASAMTNVHCLIGPDGKTWRFKVEVSRVL